MKSLSVKLGVVGLIIFGFFLVSLANAEFTLKDYESLKDNEFFENYIWGVGVGFTFANGYLINTGRPQLYCQPSKLGLWKENYSQILRDFIEGKKDLMGRLSPGFPVELLLLEALKETFPCK